MRFYGSDTDPEALSDGVYRLIEQVVQDTHLPLLKRKSVERRENVGVEKFETVVDGINRNTHSPEGSPLCCLPPIPVSNLVARDDRNPRGEVSDRMPRRCAQVANYCVLNGIARVLAVAGDEADRCDDAWVLVCNKKIQFHLGSFWRNHGHTFTT